MSVDPGLDQLSREELVQRARGLGARRPEVMTRIELRDEIVRLSEPDPLARRRSRGWLGVARDLVASVMDAGLNMPGAAAAVRGEARPAAEETTGPPPVATLTLAEIYLAQGHVERSLGVLEEVLSAEPEHPAALALKDRIARGEVAGGRRRPPPALEEEEPISAVAPAPAPFVTQAPEAPVAAEVHAVAEPYVAHEVHATSEPYAAPAVSEPHAPNVVPEMHFAPDPYAASEPYVAPEPMAATVPGSALGVPQPFVVPAPYVAPAPDVALEAQPESVESTPFVASVPSPDAVRVPAIMAVPEFDPPTLAAPPRGEQSPAAPVVIEDASDSPACALARGPGSVEGHYALPRGVSGAFLRVVWFVPGRNGPTQGSIDLPVEAARGRVTLPALDRAAHVRAALGVEAGGSFRPLAVAWVYRLGEGSLSVEFAPPGDEPSSLRAQLGRAATDLAV